MDELITHREPTFGMQLSLAPLTISTLRVLLYLARPDRSSGLLSAAKVRNATTVPVVRLSLPQVRVLEAGLESVPCSLFPVARPRRAFLWCGAPSYSRRNSDV